MYIKPNVAKGSASNYDVPTSGNAGTNQLVKGDDTRLTDARNSADVTNTYSASGIVPVSGTAVASVIGDLDVTGDSSVAASKTLASWSETDGKISITTQDISITKSQVSDFPTVDTTVTSGSGNLVTSGAVYTAIDNLPEPMVFKGTLGTGGTITTLPTAASSNEGFTYKVITAGTYSSIVCKIGDVVVSNGSEWVLIPAGDTDSDSWRNIKVNGTEKLTTALSSGSVDFVNGTNTTVSFDASGNKIAINGPTTLPASDVYSWAKESTKPSYAYSEISNTPTLGTASAKDVPTSGNASTTQVVMGNDTRLTDSRTPTSHTHTVNQITDFPNLPLGFTLADTLTTSHLNNNIYIGDKGALIITICRDASSINNDGQMGMYMVGCYGVKQRTYPFTILASSLITLNTISGNSTYVNISANLSGSAVVYIYKVVF